MNTIENKTQIEEDIFYRIRIQSPQDAIKEREAWRKVQRGEYCYFLNEHTVQSTEDGFPGRSSYYDMLGDPLMKNLKTPTLLTEYDAFFSLSVMVFRPKAGIKENLIGKAKKCFSP